MQFNTLEILTITFGVSRALVIGLWPAMMLLPLRRGRWVGVGDFVLAWFIVAAFWFGGPFLPEEYVFKWFAYIPAALDLPLFLAVGAVLGGWLLVSRRRARVRRSDAVIERRLSHAGTSPIEALFWEHAKPRIPDLQWQYPIGRYRADFFVPSARLVIELNGLAYHSGREKRIRDAIRERDIERRGYRVITFLGPEITQDPDRCVAEVLNMLAAEPQEQDHPASIWSNLTARFSGMSDRQLMILGSLSTLVALAVIALGVAVAFVVGGA